MSKQLENVSFDLIRYANCWEDADVLLNGLQPDNDSTILSIASAGDNCFSLLSAGPKKVIGVDISGVQLFLTELKQVAIRNFERYRYLCFAGFESSGLRHEMYDSIRNQLGESCRNYWDHHQQEIRKGIIHCGKFEKYFQLFKKEYLHTIHSEHVIDGLFEQKTEEQQRIYHDTVWHTEEWKKMYRFFFGEQMMGSQGRDPEFLKHVQGSVPDLILAQEVAHLRRQRVQQNYFLYYILRNRFDEAYLPHYVRAENYDKVRQHIDRLVLHHGLLDSALGNHGDCTHFNLSDIFEYMDDGLFRQVTSDLISKSAQRAKFAYWNLMIPRRMSEIAPGYLTYHQEMSEQLTDTDFGYFYRAFIVDQKR